MVGEDRTMSTPSERWLRWEARQEATMMWTVVAAVLLPFAGLLVLAWWCR